MTITTSVNIAGIGLAFNQCPKFQSCNAPICPLDTDWQKRPNHKDDATCFYLLESVKHDARLHFEVAQLGQMLNHIDLIRDDIANMQPRIKMKLESASQTGSRMTRKFGVSHE